jgi:tetratricopeptide (TPR) repeat protein
MLLLRLLYVGICFYALPAWATTAFERSESLIAAGQISEARRALRSELRMRPDHIEARYNLAVLLQEIGHDEEASALYRQNLTMAWHLPSVVNLTYLLQQQGKRNEARRLLVKATTKLRDEAAPWYLLAALSEKAGDQQLAKKCFHKAIKVDPLNGFAWLHLAEFQSLHQRAHQATKSAAKALRLLPDCAPCWRAYGEILEHNKAHEKALHAYQRSLAIQPSNKTRKLLIRTLRSLGENKRADIMQRAFADAR